MSGILSVTAKANAIDVPANVDVQLLTTPTTFKNLVWLQDPRELLSGISPHMNPSWSTSLTPAQILAKLKAAKIGTIVIGAGGWRVDGSATTSPFGETSWSQWITECVNLVHSLEPDMKVFPMFYGGITAYGPVDTLPETNKQRMVAAVEDIVNRTGADGYQDDLEDWYVAEDYSTSRDLATVEVWRRFAEKLHSMGKISSIYTWIQSGYTHADYILPYLHYQDFISLSFRPKETYRLWPPNTGPIYDPYELLGTTKILPQIRALGTDPDYHMSIAIPDWNDVVPLKPNIVGFALWNFTYTTEPEWQLWNSWPLLGI